MTGWLYELCDLEYKPIDKESIAKILDYGKCR